MCKYSVINRWLSYTHFKKYKPPPNSASTKIATAKIMAIIDIILAECSVSLLKALALSAKQVVTLPSSHLKRQKKKKNKIIFQFLSNSWGSPTYLHSFMELPVWQTPHSPTQEGGTSQASPSHSPIQEQCGIAYASKWQTPLFWQ